MAAYRDRAHGRVTLAAFLLWLCAIGGLLGIVLWRLWTEVFHGLLFS
jgi:hypothetical protein